MISRVLLVICCLALTSTFGLAQPASQPDPQLVQAQIKQELGRAIFESGQAQAQALQLTAALKAEQAKVAELEKTNATDKAKIAELEKKLAEAPPGSDPLRKPTGGTVERKGIVLP